mmetsp:Transcript_23956/g.43319  ORF Transcript_23956/g.43319 Transcript_23956/m.43319 type:complete len:98 (+) Transcript_23956:218-511(+)
MMSTCSSCIHMNGMDMYAFLFLRFIFIICHYETTCIASNVDINSSDTSYFSFINRVGDALRNLKNCNRSESWDQQMDCQMWVLLTKHSTKNFLTRAV